MPEWKYKISLAAFIIAMQCLFVLSAQAIDLSAPENASGGKILLAEAFVEYPFGWFYTLDEIEELYEIEYYENNRLDNFIRYENGRYISQCDNELSEIPEKFINTTLKMLQQMLDRRLTKYLFRLDAFHGHFFVTEGQFDSKYRNRNTLEMMQELVNDDSLRILFHCAEHLALRDPPNTGAIDKDAEQLIKLRNIIGRYDEGTIEVLTPSQNGLVGSGKSNTAIIPQGYRGVGAITFMANINGEFSIIHGGQTIWLDMSLCDYYYY